MSGEFKRISGDMLTVETHRWGHEHEEEVHIGLTAKPPVSEEEAAELVKRFGARSKLGRGIRKALDSIISTDSGIGIVRLEGGLTPPNIENGFRFTEELMTLRGLDAAILVTKVHPESPMHSHYKYHGYPRLDAVVAQ